MHTGPATCNTTIQSYKKYSSHFHARGTGSSPGSSRVIGIISEWVHIYLTHPAPYVVNRSRQVRQQSYMLRPCSSPASIVLDSTNGRGLEMWNTCLESFCILRHEGRVLVFPCVCQGRALGARLVTDTASSYEYSSELFDITPYLCQKN